MRDPVKGNTHTVRIFAISGSLRQASSNSALIDAAARLAPAGVEIAIYRELGTFHRSIRTRTPTRHLLRSSGFERLLNPLMRS
jgi:hypothetical protein